MVKKDKSRRIMFFTLLLIIFAASAGLAGAATTGNLYEGDSSTYSDNGKTFEVSISNVDYDAWMEPVATLVVNGEILSNTYTGESWTLTDGSTAHINTVDGEGETVTFTLTGSCTPNDHKGCVGSAIYWFDSCDNQGNWVQSCGYNYECVNGACQIKCGNGRCDSDETCYSCVADCGCGTYERCDGGQCKSWCGNGRCDANENCGGCHADCGCASNEECAGGRCVKLCGNNRHDSGENCATCPADFPCADTYCHNAVCVECVTDAHCEDRDVYNGEFICAPDNRRVLEKGVKHQGTCTYNNCEGEEEPITRVNKDCGELYCQDNTCGCSEGYAACTVTKNCEKERSQEANEACGCDFQCKSGYCTVDGACLDALTVVLTQTQDQIEKGEQVDVTVSADNSLNEIVNLNLVLNLGSGVTMTSVISGMDCTGNQCKISRIISERGREDVTVTLTGEGASVGEIGASVTYIVGESGKERSISEISPLTLTVTSCGDGICSEGESSQNCCGDCPCPKDKGFASYSCKEPASACKRGIRPAVFIILGSLVFIIVMGYHFAAPAMKYAHEKKKKLAEQLRQEEQERHHKEDEASRIEHERDRIKHTLEKIKEDINPNRPPSAKVVLKKLKEQFDLDFEPQHFSEEYFSFVDALKDEALAEEQRKKQAEEDEKKKKRSKFCTKCGYKLRDKVKFCTVCGAKIRFTK